MSETEMTDAEAEAIDRRRHPSLWKTWDGYTPHQRRMRDLWRATRCDMVRESLNASPSPVVEVSEEMVEAACEAYTDALDPFDDCPNAAPKAMRAALVAALRVR